MTSRRGWWLGAGMVVATAGLGVPLAGQRVAPAVAPLPSFSEPAISPDRSEIAFVSGGDVWTVPAAGGEARLLVAHEATESRPIYSPDGKRLAFISDRTGGGDIYVLTFATGALAQLTFDGGLDRLDGWSRDGAWIYFSSTSGDIAGMNDIYRVRVQGGTPMKVSADSYTGEFFAAPSPDGRDVAFSARGNGASQWWRHGRSHLDESELWLLHDGPEPRYERLTPMGAKQLWPMWSADGKSLFYVSDRTGPQNIWVLPIGGVERQVTQFKDGRVLWPTICVRRPDDRLRARLRGVVARHGERQGGPRADHQARGPLVSGDRARLDDQRLPGPRALAGRPQGGLRRPRRDLGRVRP